VSGELAALGLIEAVGRIREGRLSAEEYAIACLERIRRLEPGVQAWACLEAEQALAEARARDALRKRAALPLAGLPVGVKDIIRTRNLPTQMGSEVFSGHVAGENARIVERLEAAGGFVMGKTVTAELAYLHPGRTRNPWNPGHTPGGSSSGSAAAVAARFVPAAIGTQTNGSVIRPAAYCGVVGYKPSRYALSVEGIQHFSPTLDQIGVFCRSIADAAWFAAALASIPGSLPRESRPPTRPPRLAWLRDLPWARPDGEQAAVMEGCAATIGREGAEIRELSLPETFAGADRLLRTIMLREGAEELGPLQARERARLSSELNAALDEGARVTDTAYRGALADRDALAFELAGLIQESDAVLTPPVPGPAPAGLGGTGDPSFCTLWSLAGFPAVTIPVGMSSGGLPLGIQLTAPAGYDSRLLSVAAWCEARLPFNGLP